MTFVLRTLLFVILVLRQQVTPFSVGRTAHRLIPTERYLSDGPTEQEFRSEAEVLMARAKELRASLPTEEKKDVVAVVTPQKVDAPNSKWAVQEQSEGVGYRLEMDIGREDGTWMDPRWGASGKRIELTLDVLFSDEAATEDQKDKMVKDNFGGKSSIVSSLETASVARLRNGFDQMKCDGGAYRIDTGKNGQTCRFYVNVDGTPERGSSYGDIFIPKGCLYISMPCFGGVSQMSTKEGIVTVRQIGWHTGFRREESRMVGVVRATPIEKARRLDGF